MAGGSTAGGVTGGGSTAGGSVAGGSAGGSRQCATDAQCGRGELCYDCGTYRQCAEGCSVAKPCPTGTTCVPLNVQCLTCPCPASHCVAPTCSDVDGDGFVQGSTCGGLPGGDCAPLDPTIHPRAVENCRNGKDDDCNGLIDGADPQCASLCGTQPSCQSVHDCSLGTTTCSSSGCCMSCPLMAPPLCPPNSMPSPTTPDLFTGCPSDVRCVPVGVCPFVYAPVCAQLGIGDARTFTNSCEATSAGARLIHAGECLPAEGLLCASQGPGCDATTYCRDACPLCDSAIGQRCTKIGACVDDLDCPAGLAPPPPLTCANGTQAPLRCVNNACVRSCAP